MTLGFEIYVKRIAVLALCAASGLVAIPSDGGVTTRHVFDIHAECGGVRDAGTVPGGKRVMIPITGGKVEGELNACILPGGADYQMVDTVSGRVEFDAIYTIQTDDSKLINVRNRGVSVNDSGGYYFTTSPTFEAPVESTYNWLNNRIFICKPVGFGDGVVHLRVWVVE